MMRSLSSSNPVSSEYKSAFYKLYPCLSGCSFSESYALMMEKCFVSSLYSGAKCQTRRLFKQSRTDKHMESYNIKQLVRVWRGQSDVDTIGWVMYSSLYYQKVRDMSRDDFAHEGLPDCTIDTFIADYMMDRKTGRDRSKEPLLVLCFEFYRFPL